MLYKFVPRGLKCVCPKDPPNLIRVIDTKVYIDGDRTTSFGFQGLMQRIGKIEKLERKNGQVVLTL